ncbi:MAG: HAD family hydrolase [Pedobacter sp.]|nr:MAG: HAD family hydrolase [Pedobacter sp.]
MIVFDMAGTTVNEDNIVYKTLMKSINKIGGFDLELDEVLAHGAGKEKLQAIIAILKNCLAVEDQQLAESIFSFFLQELKHAYQVEDIFPGTNAHKLFEILKSKGILRVLNTGYDRSTAEFLLAKLNWEVGKDIDGLVTASDVPRNRPFPDMIIAAMEKFDIGNPLCVVKVGDSAIDIQEGQNAGCALSIGITTGAHTQAQLSEAGPDYIINDLVELIEIISQYEEVKLPRASAN